MPLNLRRRLRKHRMRSSRPSPSDDVRNMRTLWSLRILATALPRDASDNLTSWANRGELKGLGIHLDEEDEDGHLALEQAVQDRLQIFEADESRLQDRAIARNIRILAEPLGLNDTECEILEFLTLYTSNYSFEKLLSEVRESCDLASAEIVALSLNRTTGEIQNALSHSETLVRSGLVTVSSYNGRDLGFDLLDSLASQLLGTLDSPPTASSRGSSVTRPFPRRINLPCHTSNPISNESRRYSCRRPGMAFRASTSCCMDPQARGRRRSRAASPAKPSYTHAR